MDKKKEQLLIDTIANQIIQASDTKVNKSAIDRTYEATIVRVLFNKNTIKTDDNYNKYRVRYGNSEQDIIIDDGNAHSVNEKVYITAPCNNLSKKIISADNCVSQSKAEYVEGGNTETVTINNVDYVGTIDELKLYQKCVTEYEKDKSTQKYKTDETTGNLIPANSFEYMKEYKFLVLNKGTDNQEYKAIISPNGNVIELKGF